MSPVQIYSQNCGAALGVKSVIFYADGCTIDTVRAMKFKEDGLTCSVPGLSGDDQKSQRI